MVVDIASARAEFGKQYPNVESCLNELLEFRLKNGQLRCECNSPEFRRIDARRVACMNCRVERSITAGTIFHGGRKLYALFGLAYFMALGVAISAGRAAQVFDISKTSAFEFMMFLRQCIERSIDFPGDAFALRAYLGAIGKRSCVTPAKSTVREEAVLADGAVEADAASELQAQIAAAVAADPNNWTVLHSLSSAPASEGRLLESTGLSAAQLSVCLVDLSLRQLIQSQSTGVWVARKVNPTAVKVTQGVEKAVRGFLQFIQANFHRVSKKYLQLYAIQFGLMLRANDRVYQPAKHAFFAERRCTPKMLEEYDTPSHVVLARAS